MNLTLAASLPFSLSAVAKSHGWVRLAPFGTDTHTGGLTYVPSSATLYVWVRVPPGMTSARFASGLLEGAGVSLAPGTAFGLHGEGYARISLVQPVARLEEAMGRWERWMG